MSEIKIFKNKAYTQVSATGGERELDFGFPLFSSAHIKVEEVQTDGTVKELVLETDYTVQGVGQQTGGTITLTTASYPNGAIQGYTYNLIQNVPEERTSDFQQSGDFLADTLNTELDLMTQQIQQLRRDVDQAVDVPLGDDPAQFLENFFEDVEQTAQNAQAASSSATAAATSAAAAQASAEQAQAVSDAFETLANEATLTFNQNAQSKTDAFNANAAEKQETMNETLEDVETYALQAEASKDSAASSATAAAGSATTAQNAAEVASTKASEATESSALAGTKASEAAASASSAAGSATTASTAAETAGAKASEAGAAATAAAGSATAAATSAALAESWAIGDSEERPEGSAKYWAEQASAGQVQADWSQTDTTAKDFIKNKPTNLLQNTATAQNALTILGTASTSAVMASSINIGYGSAASRNTVALGYNAKASNSYCTSIGYDSQATGYDATAVGEGAHATGSAAIAMGRDAIASAADAIQIGTGTNATAATLAVGFKGSGVNYTLLTGAGTIPAARFASYDASSKTLILGGNS